MYEIQWTVVKIWKNPGKLGNPWKRLVSVVFVVNDFETPKRPLGRCRLYAVKRVNADLNRLQEIIFSQFII